MKNVLAAFRILISASNALGTLWICFLMLVITFDVSGRTFFHSPLVGTPEIVSNSIVVIAFLQLAYVLAEGRHIRATVVYDLCSERGKAFLDILTYLIGIFLFLALIKSSWNLFLTAMEVGEFEGEGAMRIPTSPVRFVILFGSGLMLIQFMLLTVEKVKRLFAKTPQQDKA